MLTGKSSVGWSQAKAERDKLCPVPAHFYFYFADEATARQAVPRLEQEGLTVEVRLGADEGSWLALGSASLESEEQLDEYEERFEELASELGAEYDGYDRA